MSDEETEEEPTMRMVVAEYARSKGIPVEEAMQKFLPVLRARSRNPLVAKALEAAHVLGEISSVTEGADPVTKELLATLAGNVVGRSLGESGDPVDEAIRDVTKYVAKVKAIDAAFGSGDIEKVREELKALRDEIGNKKRSEEVQGIIDKMEELVGPLQNRLDMLETMRGEGEPGEKEALNPDEIFSHVSKITDDAKSWLQRTGYKVEMEKGLSKEEIQKMIEEAQKNAIESLPPEELKQRVEKAGYKIVGGPMSYEQVEKLVQEATRKAQEEVLDDKRIEAVESIVRDATKQIVGMFSPAVKEYMKYAFKARGGEGTSSSQEESSTREASGEQ